MEINQPDKEAEILQQIIAALSPLEPEARARLIDTVARFFDLRRGALLPRRIFRDTEYPTTTDSGESDDAAPSAKDFLIEKNPQTLVERIACLAYYLTHYQETPHFKTFDISKLNTEAAQVKFSNTAQSVADATKMGFLAAATRGNKQLSAMGEKYVEALPDREEARAVAKRLKPRKPRRKKSKTSR